MKIFKTLFNKINSKSIEQKSKLQYVNSLINQSVQLMKHGNTATAIIKLQSATVIIKELLKKEIK